MGYSFARCRFLNPDAIFFDFVLINLPALFSVSLLNKFL